MKEKENNENELCMVYDLVEYRLKKYIDSFPQGTAEWDVAMRLMLLYLDKDVTVKWCEDGMLITATSEEIEQVADLLIPNISLPDPNLSD